MCKNPPHQELQSALIVVILYLLDVEERRKYIRPGYDLRILLSPITDEFDYQDVDKDLFWKNVMQSVILLLRSWSGIFYLNACGGFDSIVAALSLKSSKLHVCLFLFSITIIYTFSLSFSGSRKTNRKLFSMDCLKFLEFQLWNSRMQREKRMRLN